MGCGLSWGVAALGVAGRGVASRGVASRGVAGRGAEGWGAEAGEEPGTKLEAAGLNETSLGAWTAG